MKIICDTHVLLFWADAPEQLSNKATRTLRDGMRNQQMACADISLWEIAMLAEKGRITPQEPVDLYIADIIAAMALEVLPISPEIAALSQTTLLQHQDPADRLIAATTLHHKARLVTKDRKLQAFRAIETLW